MKKAKPTPRAGFVLYVLVAQTSSTPVSAMYTPPNTAPAAHAATGTLALAADPAVPAPRSTMSRIHEVLTPIRSTTAPEKAPTIPAPPITVQTTGASHATWLLALTTSWPNVHTAMLASPIAKAASANRDAPGGVARPRRPLGRACRKPGSVRCRSEGRLNGTRPAPTRCLTHPSPRMNVPFIGALPAPDNRNSRPRGRAFPIDSAGQSAGSASTGRRPSRPDCYGRVVRAG